MAAQAVALVPARSTPQVGALRRFWRRPLARLGLVLVALLVVAAVFAPVLAGHSDPNTIFPNGTNAVGVPHSPGGGFLLGANTQGQDVWTRLLFGARVSLTVAICAMVTSTLIGTSVGLVGGYFGGATDRALTRITEVVTSLPTILLAIALAAALPDHLPNFWLFKLARQNPDLHFFRLLLAIALVTWTGIARAVRGQTLALKEREFVEAARAFGCSHATILRRHLLPNVLPTVITLATLATANNILLEAGLSYLSLGLDPSVASWGGLISNGQPNLLTAPWIAVSAGVAIVLAVTGFNLLGTALQETLERG